jgi:hypothetical protein
MLKIGTSLVYAVAAILGLIGIAILALSFVILAGIAAVDQNFLMAGTYAFAALGAAHVTTLLVDSAHKVATEFLDKGD